MSEKGGLFFPWEMRQKQKPSRELRKRGATEACQEKAVLARAAMPRQGEHGAPLGFCPSTSPSALRCAQLHGIYSCKIWHSQLGAQILPCFESHAGVNIPCLPLLTQHGSARTVLTQVNDQSTSAVPWCKGGPRAPSGSGGLQLHVWLLPAAGGTCVQVNHPIFKS